MKRAAILLFCFVSITMAHAQQMAVTQTGEQVILFDDGTWTYQDKDALTETEIQTNSTKFIKDVNSTFLIKSEKVDVGFWLNPKIWAFKKSTDNPDAEYELQLKGEDLYGMIISEKVEIPLETLKSIALENGRAVAPDLKVVKEEYRSVNGLKVLFLQMNGTMQGVKFSYYGYYFSTKNGSIQYITYTSQNLQNSYIKECENLLNGLVELN